MTINPVIAMLADIRRAAGISQRQVADAMGTRQSAVSEMETGVVTDVRLSTLRRYATAVGVELDVTVRPATPASAGEPKAQSKDLRPEDDYGCFIADKCVFDQRCPHYSAGCSRFAPAEPLTFFERRASADPSVDHSSHSQQWAGPCPECPSDLEEDGRG